MSGSGPDGYSAQGYGTSYPDGPRRLGATDGRAHQVLGLALFVVCPAVTVVYGVANTSRTPVPFVATIVAQLAATAYLVWLARAWARPTRRPGAADLALAVVPLLLAGVGLWLLQELAYAYGIRGSALARVQQDIAFPADVAYLGAIGVVLVSALAALALLALLLRARWRDPSRQA